VNLFDPGNRTDTRFKGYKEPEFAYLNQSARPAIIALRELLEDWFRHFPTDSQTDLCSRFRSPDDNQHAGAFFELYIHELLRKLGYEITVHPVLPGIATHPDFLARRSEGCQFYLEVTLAGVPNKAEQGAAARIAQVYDVLNEMDSPDYFLHLDVEGSPSTPPAGAKLRSDLGKWLGTLDVDEIAKAGQRGEFAAVPKFHWEHEGWSVTFMPIAKSPAARGKPGIRPIGAIIPEAEWLKTDVDLKNALENKAKKYGALEVPLVVAVNVLGIHCDETDIFNAVFGQEVIAISQRNDGSISAEHAERRRNGFWFGPNGPRNQSVSAVLIIDGFNEWKMGTSTPELFHNPWPGHPLNPDYWLLPQRIPNMATRGYDKRPGRSAREVMGIPDPWPPSSD
jgi:hypothetical protein